ncbi:class I SAM-dependent methyltransferase [Nocardia sp. CDC160]|uniref:class I SAM-dependent methyltransferase n=1 Tax=Nocardia sp. CDC160 TaxID=3112166 RepID=UPI002DBF8CA5|nr:class I SAM-dependent methyltransferase [Nocardia sp. CDC160]MEC3915592.1 class I SAM-dependent methyltransferase [Nocardia sp. CDC160]
MPAIADIFTDRILKNPRGLVARFWWRDMKAHHDIFRETLQALALTAEDNLIEIGCGGGTFINWALESGCRATAVDHSADMVALTEKNNAEALRQGRLEVVRAAAEALPLPDATYTAAALMNVLFFLDAPRALAEVHRVLAPGGRLVVHSVAPNPPSKIAPAPVARRMRLYTDEEIRTLLEAAGFSEVRITRTNGVFQLATALRPATAEQQSESADAVSGSESDRP